MALLKFKRSAVSGKVPALADLELGELAINTFDGKLYLRKDNGTASIVEVGAGAGSGVLSFNTRTGNVTLTSGDVTGALGYTPANRAGDTFTGAITVNNGSHQVHIASDGNIEITRSGGGAYIDFKDSTGEDFDARIQQSGSGFALTGLLTVSGTGLNAAIRFSNSTGGRDYRLMQKDGGYLAITDETAGAERLLINSSGNVTALVDFRAPIFYDYNNTGYYVDPASTSVINGLNVASSFPVFSSGSFQYHQYQSPHVAYVKKTGGYSWYWRRNDTGLAGGANEVENMSLTEGGTLAVNGDMRAPLFYDANNTSYYLDPAGMNSISSLEVRDGDINISRTTNAWGYIVRPNVAGYKNLQFAVVGGGALDNVYANTQALRSAGDVRGTMFYDEYDTTWYLDPNGTSRIYRLKVAGETEYPGSINGDYEGGYYHFGPSDNTPTGSYGHAHIIRLNASWNVQMFFPTSNTNEPMWLRRKQNGTYSAWRRLLQEDEWIGSKYLASDGRIYGTILYDSNDSSRYVNPASESVLNTLTLFGELNLSAGTTYVDHSGTIVFRNQANYVNSATLTTGGDFTASGNVTAYSDARLKDNVETVNDALDLVSAMRGVTYTRKDTGQAGVGVIAQEMRKVLPQVVIQADGDDDTLSVAYGNIVGVLIEAIKELNTKVKDLEAELRSN